MGQIGHEDILGGDFEFGDALGEEVHVHVSETGKQIAARSVDDRVPGWNVCLPGRKQRDDAAIGDQHSGVFKGDCVGHHGQHGHIGDRYAGIYAGVVCQGSGRHPGTDGQGQPSQEAHCSFPGGVVFHDFSPDVAEGAAFKMARTRTAIILRSASDDAL